MRRCTRCSRELHDFTIFCPQCGQPHEANFDQLIDRSLDGRYFIYRRLGEGGLSTVFGAVDLRSDSVVAIKVSDPRHLANRNLTYALEPAVARRYWTEMLERMRREAEELADLEHPNLVRILSNGSIDADLRYVVMEFLQGRTLREALQENGPIGPDHAAKIVDQIASGLEVVHARGIVHRDLNPRNIFLCDEFSRARALAQLENSAAVEIVPLKPQPNPLSTGDLRIKVIDFGIAKFPQPPGAPPFTQHSVMRGTVAYSSPEQCQSKPLDHRSDIYSLGIVVFEMLAGERPFSGRTPTEIALKQIQDEPPRLRDLSPHIPVGLENAVHRALAKDPADRQQSITEFADEMGSAQRRVVIPLVPAPAFYETPEEDEFESAEPVAPVGDGDWFYHPEVTRKKFTWPRTAALVLALGIGAWAIGKFLLHPAQDIAQRPIAVSPTPSVEPSSTVRPQATSPNQPDALELAARLPASAITSPTIVPQVVSPIRSHAPRIAKRAAAAGSRRSAPESPIATHRGSKAGNHGSQTALSLPTLNTPRASQPKNRQSAPEPSSSQTSDSSGPAAQTSVPPELERANGRVARNDHETNAGTPSVQQPPEERHREPPIEPPSGRPVMGPTLISWSGFVNHERTVTLELPGTPGTVEIPRSYSRKVGMVEPPTSDNGWRRVVLRIIGDGEVSIVVRWWPQSSSVATNAGAQR
jgi:serine/threonine protein kinase